MTVPFDISMDQDTLGLVDSVQEVESVSNLIGYLETEIPQQ